MLNRARWSPLAMSLHLLLLIVETSVPARACVDLVSDETLAQRRGNNRTKRGQFRESTLSSTERSANSRGLRWIVIAVAVSLPWTK
jgi:hypothetical protein